MTRKNECKEIIEKIILGMKWFFFTLSIAIITRSTIKIEWMQYVMDITIIAFTGILFFIHRLIRKKKKKEKKQESEK